MSAGKPHTRVTVVGAKGGVGTTTLATAIARRHAGVLWDPSGHGRSMAGVLPSIDEWVDFDPCDDEFHRPPVRVWDQRLRLVNAELFLLVTDNTYNGLRGALRLWKDWRLAGMPAELVVIERGAHGALSQFDCQDILPNFLWVPHSTEVSKACDHGKLGETFTSTQAFTPVFQVIDPLVLNATHTHTQQKAGV